MDGRKQPHTRVGRTPSPPVRPRGAGPAAKLGVGRFPSQGRTKTEGMGDVPRPGLAGHRQERCRLFPVNLPGNVAIVCPRIGGGQQSIKPHQNIVTDGNLNSRCSMRKVLVLIVVSTVFCQAAAPVFAQANNAILRSQTDVATSAIAQQIREATRGDRDARAASAHDRAAVPQNGSVDKADTKVAPDASHQLK